MDRELEAQLSGMGITGAEGVENDCGAEISKIYAPYEKVVLTWQKLRSEAPALGYWPVICGIEKHAGGLFQMLQNAHTNSRREEAEARASGEDVLAKRRAERLATAPHGPWPTEPSSDGGIYLAQPPRAPEQRSWFRRKPTEPQPDRGAVVLLLPVREWAEIFPLVSFGGWNECPSSSEHVAILRYWDKKYGLDLIAMRHDTLEFMVRKRPDTQDDALKLAEEQFVYCNDIVDQGTQTLENLAAALLEADHWFFWWD